MRLFSPDAAGTSPEDFVEHQDSAWVTCANTLYAPVLGHPLYKRNIAVKIHTGGVSRSGVSRAAGFEVVKDIQPDVAAHITGGPIPMPPDVQQVLIIPHTANPQDRLALIRTFAEDVVADV